MAAHRWSPNIVWMPPFAILTLLLLGALWIAPCTERPLQASGQPVPGPQAALPEGVTLEGPFTHANLALYVVRGSTSDTRAYITLDEGLAAGTVVVREKGSGQDRAEVNTLDIENRSDKWLFLQAGDIVKGGKQDRTITTDVTLAPRSGRQPLEAFCVEHGRWTAGGDGLAFGSNPGIVAGAPLKMAIQSAKSQTKVWEEVAKAEDRAVMAARAVGAPVATHERLSSTGTYNAIAEQKALSANRGAYVAALMPHVRKYSDAIGLAVAINGTMTSADVYGSPALFERLSAKLLNSYALEAVLAEARPGPLTAPNTQQVTAFLLQPDAARPATEAVGRSMQRATRETDQVVVYEYIHVNESSGAAKPGPVPVHKSYLKK